MPHPLSKAWRSTRALHRRVVRRPNDDFDKDPIAAIAVDPADDGVRLEIWTPDSADPTGWTLLFGADLTWSDLWPLPRSLWDAYTTRMAKGRMKLSKEYRYLGGAECWPKLKEFERLEAEGRYVP